jgi:cysteine desulfurase
MKLPIYLDYHATTPVDPRALETMLPYFGEKFGNPASRSHSFGWDADKAVDQARAEIAALIGARDKEIVFTSGATESNNLAIKGVAHACRARGNHIITAVTEHKSVLDTCKRLEGEGFEVTRLPVQPDGLIDLTRLSDAITPRTILISIMTANNEIGVLQPIEAIGRLARERGIVFHTDAAQAAGKVPIDVAAGAVDLLSFTAHKMYGPKGIGALFVCRRDPKIEIEPLVDGGGHERGLRSGTLNVPGIVGFGKASALARAELPEESARLAALRDRLLAELRRAVSGLRVNGSLERRLPHNLNVSVPAVQGETLMLALSDVAVSAGSACSSGAEAPSHVLTALGSDEDLAYASIRFGLGRFTTSEEIDYVIEKIGHVVSRLREMSPS